MSDFNGIAVTHSVYGKGNIEQLDDDKLTVCFEDGKEKQFLFPNSVGTFLKTEDTELLGAVKLAKDAISAETERIRLKQEEEEQKRIQSIEVTKKAAPRKRKTTKTGTTKG